MRVAILTEDWPATTGGGVAAITRTLADALHADGVELEVWTRGGGARDAGLLQDRSAYPVVPVPGRSWRTRGPRHWRRALPGLQTRFGPDAVLASTWLPLAGGGVSSPAHVFAHGRDVTGDPGADRRGGRAEVFAAAGSWLCLTAWMQRELVGRGVAPAAIEVVPAAVPDPPDSVRAPEPGRVLCVGRLVPRKGQDVLIEAVARRPDLRLDLVGEGPDRHRLQQQIRDRGLSDRVALHGWVPAGTLEGLWARAAVLALPARQEAGGDTEGYGLVFLEAGARGVPVVGGRTAGVAEAVVHGETGLLVDDPGDPEAVAQALCAAQDERFGAAGRLRHQSTHRPAHLAAAVRAVLEAS